MEVGWWEEGRARKARDQPSQALQLRDSHFEHYRYYADFLASATLLTLYTYLLFFVTRSSLSLSPFLSFILSSTTILTLLLIPFASLPYPQPSLNTCQLWVVKCKLFTYLRLVNRESYDYFLDSSVIRSKPFTNIQHEVLNFSSKPLSNTHLLLSRM